MDHLAEHEAEMTRRRAINATLKDGQEPMPLYAPKVVITSGYTTFGAEVIEEVLKDIQRDTGRRYGMYTGDADQKKREEDKVNFAQSDDFNFMVVSDAGKEGIGLGNGHMLIHYDQDFNPNLMAQKTARVLRSNSWKNAAKEKRENTVKIVSVTMPGTIEDSVIRAQQRKLDSIAKVEGATRKAEGQKGKSDFAEVRAGAPKKWVQRIKTDKTASIPLVTTWLNSMQ
jgi:SNF2 family DNA or RNA helicase